ncbi:beta-ketoacyl-[acyl-carrier-protein] synthase family protein [Streptomyces sp. 1331.2]|uniref:beta-ketoacyl-[acyl-carrier-protein] synthase family protein n=1 Tax=Streptomyces sp. 1331.2 TaxID=1938835 RepID=UPI000BCAAA6B|nr:beta-ketoacyl-[acyl-carrier-protein] synthase family protein [Streptomyces sp. 1331.2]SOB83252.1 3-oxoacyl-[acyl-carrier-protein] synthase II [Streptomyces sp. 1331.2]
MAAEVRPDDVCVTGLAWTTPLGDTPDGVWRRLLAGEHGLRETPSPYPVRNVLAATVPGLDLAAPATERQLALTVETLTSGLASAGLDPADPGVRIVLGTSYGPLLDEPAAVADDWAVAAARRIGHPHRPVTVSTACSAGSDAILLAAELIRAGHADAVVAGGVDVLTLGKRLGHTALGTMSPDLLRAFDREHSGMLLGEGAAVLVLERAEAAHRRGAPVRAVLRGAGSANDASGLTAPDPTGDSIVLAVRRALATAGRTTRDVTVLNAHATGTPVNDAVESTSLRRLFAGTDGPPVVFATKGALGHSLGATGAIEAVSVLLALRDRLVPPVYGLLDPLPDFPLPLAVDGPRAVAPGLGASLTIGFGGFNTCLLFEGVDA